LVRSKHAFFKHHPLDGQIAVGDEILTTPYLIYDGFMLLHGGTVDAQVASRLLENEELMPLLDTNGRALAAIWVCDFSEANLGPHQELQISLFATFRPVPPIEADPFAIFRALMRQPDTHMVCHGLWNSTA